MHAWSCIIPCFIFDFIPANQGDRYSNSPTLEDVFVSLQDQIAFHHSGLGLQPQPYNFEIARLEEVLNGLFDQPVEVHKFCIKFGKLLFGGDLIGSALPNCCLSSSLIQAFWPTAPDPVSSHDQCGIGEVQYFLDVAVTPKILILRPTSFKVSRSPHFLLYTGGIHINRIYFWTRFATGCETMYQSRWNYLLYGVFLVVVLT